MKNNYQITAMVHEFIKKYIREDDICLDLTVGKGQDAQFLLSLIPEGFLYGFDIQPEAVSFSEKLLKEKHDNYKLILDSHENLDEYVDTEIGCAILNLGYLPGGNHVINTKAETTISAIRKAMNLLRVDGIISICFYPGTETGKKEMDEVLEFLKTVDSHRFLVILDQFYNRPNNPPTPAYIIRTE